VKLGFRGIRGATSSHSYPRYVLATIRKEQGKLASAIANLDRYALKGKEASGAVYRMRAQIHADAGEHEAAAVLMEKAWERFDHSPGIVVAVIEAYSAADRGEDAYELASHCAVAYPAIKSNCWKGAESTTPAVAADGEASEGSEETSWLDFLFDAFAESTKGETDGETE
jgi:hypothetical protein